MPIRTPKTIINNWFTDIFFITISIAVFYFIALGTRPLFVPDEGRYAEMVREMVSNHDYFIPHLNGLVYFEKPILFFWLGALASKIAGMNLWALRSVNAILAILGCQVAYCAGRHFFDRITGLIAAFILATSPLYFFMGHMISLDLAVSIFITISLLSCLWSVTANSQRERTLAAIISTLATSCAVLTKGLIGVTFPLLVMACWLTLLNKWHEIKTLPLLLCVLLFLLVTLPWHMIAGFYYSSFFDFYVIHQQFLRFLDPHIGHSQPFWFFLPVILLGFMPWSFFILPVIRQTYHQRLNPTILFLALWVILIFLFFSCSQSKLIPYILPIFPALALLTAHYLRLAYPIVCVRAGAIGSAIFLLWCLIVAFPHFDQRSIKPLADTLQQVITENDVVITYDQYYQDLPFYLGRVVNVLNWKNELQYGINHQLHHEWMIDDNQFWELSRSSQRVFIFISEGNYLQLIQQHPTMHFHVLARVNHTFLLSNHVKPNAYLLDTLTH